MLLCCECDNKTDTPATGHGYSMAAAAVQHVQPVFLVNNSLPATEEKPYSVSELCSAAEKVCGYNNMEGAQRIRGLWRLYPKTQQARIDLLSKGLTLRGTTVMPRDVNPFILGQTSGDAETPEKPTTKLIIGDIPISCSNEEIRKAIENMKGVQLRSTIIEERDRDEKGKLTRWKTGRRFAYIDVPQTPLPKALDISIFRASLYHKEQRVPNCSNCLGQNHHHSTCGKPVKCRQCYQDGHRKGDPECQLAPPPPPQQPPPPVDGDEKTDTQALAPTAVKAGGKQTLLPFSAASAKGATATGGVRGRSHSCHTKRSYSSSPGASPSPTGSPNRQGKNRQQAKAPRVALTEPPDINTSGSVECDPGSRREEEAIHE